MARKWFLRAGTLLVAIVAGCTVTTGTPSSCSSDSSIVGCTGTSVGYSCTGNETPAATDSSLNCSVGVPGKPGSTRYCCETITAASSCAVDTAAVSCLAGSTGYSCTGSRTPPQDNASLRCGSGISGNAGATLFCCTSVAPGVDTDAAAPSCMPSTGPSGCPAPLTEYSCTSGTPAPLPCGPGIAGSAGNTLYCCSSGATGGPTSEAGAIDSNPSVDTGSNSTSDAASEAGTCAVGATTASANCDQCLSSQCCAALVACAATDAAGVNDAGASACEQLLGCIVDCVAGNPDAGVAPGTLSDCQSVCGPSYTSSEQQNASGVLACQSSSCSSSCP